MRGFSLLAEIVLPIMSASHSLATDAVFVGNRPDCLLHVRLQLRYALAGACTSSLEGQELTLILSYYFLVPGSCRRAPELPATDGQPCA